jgi:hypothetical protein
MFVSHPPSGELFFPDRSGRTAAILFWYTGPVQPGTTQNRMNSNFKSKSVVQSVWSGVPTGSTGPRLFKQKNRISGEFDVFSNLN